MGAIYRCSNRMRHTAVKTAKLNGKPVMNGIDYLEVSEDNITLYVYFIHDLPGQGDGPDAEALGISNISIESGKKRIPIRKLNANHRLLTINLKHPGDFSAYTLRLMASPSRHVPPRGYDPMLSEVDFRFMLECSKGFDCGQASACPQGLSGEPPVDYMAKDYASFRRLMLDRLSMTLPGWEERNPADAGVAIVEILAYAADQLSYYQDAVATEAYLGTARSRASIRRHARLLDYHMGDGCNARAWVHVEVCADYVKLGKGTRLLTRFSDHEGRIPTRSPLYGQAKTAGSLVFETMHDAVLFEGLNEMGFYTWDDGQCCLPKGATRATFENNGHRHKHLAVGQVLVFEEVLGNPGGRPEDADPSRRHAVRLTKVEFTYDPLYGEGMPVVNVEWAKEDALPFPLCLSLKVQGPGGMSDVQASRAVGNIVLADHGETVEENIVIIGQKPCPLSMWPVTRQCHMRDERGHDILYDADAPAAAALGVSGDMRHVRPSIGLFEEGVERESWEPVEDLLNSGRFATDFVVESGDDGTARIRFGNGTEGKRPAPDTGFNAIYRIGNGRAGNVGPEAIAHVLSDDDGVLGVRNPMPASGGTDPEDVEQVRRDAPQAFYVQERAVTAPDYADMAMRHPEVQKAAAVLRWTGSWHTMYVAVDRKGGLPVDEDFREEMGDFLELYRLAGHDVEINAPVFVPLLVELAVCVCPGYVRNDVRKALLDVFSSHDLPDGRRGFFHPDNFTFGQTVYLSQVIALAAGVPGVQWVEAKSFRRWGKRDMGEMGEGCIVLSQLEIARADNDPNHPENGKVDFSMLGGI